MKKILLPLTLSLMIAPTIANASEVELGYDSLTLSGVSLTGLSVSGSLDLTDSFSPEMSGGSVDTKLSGVKVSLKSTGLGVGYNTEFGETIDLKLVVLSVDQTLTLGWSGYTASANGSSVVYGGSLRAGFTESVDGFVGLTKSTEAGSNTNTSFGISVGVSDTLDLTIGSSSDSVVKVTTLGLRYNF